jgi:hypothetical protein
MGLVSPILFGGTMTPDQMAKELFDDGLIFENSVQSMWKALDSEVNQVAKNKENLKAAKQAVQDAKKQARKERDEGLQERFAEQERDHNKVTRIRRYIAQLEAIVTALPADVRGKIGGFSQISKANTDEKALEILTKRLEKVDDVMQKHFKRKYGVMVKKMFDRAKPKKDESGSKKMGRIGPVGHRIFNELKDVMLWSPEALETEVAKYEKALTVDGITAEEELYNQTMLGLAPMFADWENASAGRRGAALRNGNKIIADGSLEAIKKKKEQRLKDELQVKALKRESGSKGTALDREKKAEVDKSFRSLPVKSLLNLVSFSQFLGYIFGTKSKLATKFSDMERLASNKKEDSVNAEMDQISDLFTEIAGDAYKGELLRYEMAQKSLEIKVNSSTEHFMSELEAIDATMMWEQEDGKRHMRGKFDENGNLTTSWRYKQDFIDEIEAKLSDEAKAVRAYLRDNYSKEWEQMNPIHVDLYGIDMERHAKYSPLSVKPSKDFAGSAIDPVTGIESRAVGISPSSLKNRSRVAIAEPRFHDALQKFIGHKKQIEHWKAYAPPLMEMQRTLKDRELLNSVQGAVGVEGLNVMNSWLDFLALGGVRDMSDQLAINNQFKKMTGRAASSALIGRMSVLAIQSTQLGAALAKMPMAAYISRMGKLLTGQLGWKDSIKSEYIQRRVKAAPPIVQQALESLASSKPSKVKFWVSKMGELISGADALFTAGTYAIIRDYQYTQAIKAGKSEAEANKIATLEADRLTDDVAQPVRSGARSMMENTSTNVGMKLMWAFSSEPRQKLALAAMALTKGTNAEKARALAVTWGIGGGMAALVRAVMADIRSDDDEEFFDDRHWNPKRLALQTMTGPLQGFPIVGSVAEAGVFKLAGEYLPEGNLFDSASKGAVAAQNIFTGKSFEDDGKLVRDIDRLLSGMALFNDSAAAYSSISHLLKDMFSITKNVAK